MTAGGGKPATGVGRSKRKRTASAEPAVPEAGDTAFDLGTFEGRLKYRDALSAELQAKRASYKRSVQIGHEIRLIQHQAKESAEHDELLALRELAQELRKVQDAQARMRSGVQRADQAPELPVEGSPEPN